MSKRKYEQSEAVAKDCDDILKKRRVEKSCHKYWVGVTEELPSIEQDCLCVTSVDGDSVYVGISPEEHVFDFYKEDTPILRQQTTSLLSQPISELMKKADELRFHSKSKEKIIDSFMAELDDSSALQNSSDPRLLVNKYAPKSFVDLVSNERINREVLKWIKEFDDIVFKKTKDKQVPSQKILLLTGPPGVGKTTLAHIIARHAGYEPVEINASDDRSPEKIKEFLEAGATRDILNSKKPKLLIFDEIDGVANGSDGKSAVDLILKSVSFVKSEGKKKDGKEAKKKRSFPYVQTPIICICNDQYAPSLRELRQKSRVFVFSKQLINVERIVDRLLHICKQEGVESIPKRIISELVQKNDGDVRSCLNSLQFLKKQLQSCTSKEITKVAEESLASFSANKDVKKDYFDTCSKIFFTQQVSKLESVKHLYSILSADFESDKYLNGCFESYSCVQYQDINLRNTWNTLHWTSLADIVGSKIRQTQNYGLHCLYVFSIISYHVNCSSAYRSELKFPREDFETKMRLRNSENVLRSFHSGFTAPQYSCYSNQSLAMDMVPLLFRILNPKLRNVTSYDVLNQQEKDVVKRLVDLHIPYRISYKQAMVEGKMDFTMDPDLEILQFSSTVSKLSYHLRRIIANEIEMQKIRSSTSVLKRQDNPKTSKETISNGVSKPISTPKIATPEKKKSEKTKDNTLRSFFKIPTAKPETPKSTKDEKSKQNQNQLELTSAISYLYFKYHEGMTNAVRRPAKLKDFV